MTIILNSLAICGYRSFGVDLQYFEKFAKINLFIGQNNAGKSNVLRFIYEVMGRKDGYKQVLTEPLARHLPNHPELIIGQREAYHVDPTGSPVFPEGHRYFRGIDTGQVEAFQKSVGPILTAQARHLGKEFAWSFHYPLTPSRVHESWDKAVESTAQGTIGFLWRMMTRMDGGSPEQTWKPAVKQIGNLELKQYRVEMLPAIREIGAKGSISEAFDGEGIIERLAKLQNPDVLSQNSRKEFEKITDFVRNVLDSPMATIEIPYDRDTIVIHMNGKALPIESLGSGIHEVIILAAAATVLSDSILCIEEPEIHLNPILQKKLIRYLSDRTSNQYFITTHSPALMDTTGAEIYHITQKDGVSKVRQVTSDSHKSAVCEDLGYHPSDLLQANCIIWVEGPSDRIYLNAWIASVRRDLIEGVHYSIMFYGGRLHSHLSNEETNGEVNDFISLRRLNRRGVMLMDSDRDKPRASLNATKIRLRQEFDAGPGHCWITEGREIENYLPAEVVRATLQKLYTTSVLLSDFTKYENRLKIRSQRGREHQAQKVDVAKYITQNFAVDLSQYDLRNQILKLVKFIAESNSQGSLSKGVAV